MICTSTPSRSMASSRTAASQQAEVTGRNSSSPTIMVGDEEFRPVTSACWDAAVRLEAMDRDGVDVQIICATPLLFFYHRPAAQAPECARLFNDAGREI